MTLYDAYGRAVDTTQLRAEQAAPTMTGVRNIYSVMHPSVGLTPEKLGAILRQAEFGDPYPLSRIGRRDGRKGPALSRGTRDPQRSYCRAANNRAGGLRRH